MTQWMEFIRESDVAMLWIFALCIHAVLLLGCLVHRANVATEMEIGRAIARNRGLVQIIRDAGAAIYRLGTVLGGNREV